MNKVSKKLIRSGPKVINYQAPGLMGERFLKSDAFVTGIMGPIGSGKSTACVMKLVRGYQKQVAGPDGVVRRRSAIIRNSYPELKTTTIKTFHDWIPESIGKWVEQGPPTHRIFTVDEKNAITSDWEIIFLALDRSEDIRKLLSMELSDAWINEAREIPKAILDGLTGRIGRYPAIRDGGCTDPQIVMDTNPPDTDHWWAKLADFQDVDMQARSLEIEEKLRVDGALKEGQPLFKFFRQPGGRTPKAENIPNLPAGYYPRVMAGKSDEWIKVYVDGDYGFVMDGRPVYPEYRDNVHCKAFALNRALPIYVGIDFGLTPAATFGQRSVTGQWRVVHELVTEDMGAKRFGDMLATTMRERFHGFAFAAITGDPAGDARAQTDETTPFQILRSCNVEASPAPTNDFTKRREAVAFYLNRMVDGEPGLLIHPDCQKLRKGMAGGYHYRRVQGVGERFHDQPDKNMSSHVAESLQYMMLGGGEARTILRRDPSLRPRRQRFAIMDDSTWG
jgi:hypothetical protein